MCEHMSFTHKQIKLCRVKQPITAILWGRGSLSAPSLMAWSNKLVALSNC